MYIRETSYDDMVHMFPVKPIEVIKTQGLQYGIIAKFNKYYMKIYKVPKNMVVIQKFGYHLPDPFEETRIPFEELPSYLSNEGLSCGRISWDY